jgi:hypothetical protein
VTCQARHKISTAAASQQSPQQYRISSRDQAPSAPVPWWMKRAKSSRPGQVPWAMISPVAAWSG